MPSPSVYGAAFNSPELADARPTRYFGTHRFEEWACGDCGITYKAFMAGYGADLCTGRPNLKWGVVNGRVVKVEGDPRA